MRFDSDGLLSPRVHPRLSVLRSYSVFRQRGWPGLAAAPLAAAKELLYGLLPAAYERPMMRHLDHADIIAIESPLAAARVQRLLRHFGRTDLAERVAVVPHGVTSNMSATSAPRKPRIIAVGRWDSHEKDPVLLARTLRLALLANRECDACIVGGGEPLLRRAIHRHAAAVEDRIGILGRQPHDALPSLYREARVLLVTSRYESFHMGAAEALCCGCSVVGPAAIAPLHAFAGHASGTLATDRSPAAMADAVACEMAAWDDGERDATAIGAWACGQFHAGAVARRIVALLNPPTSA
jgi:glycosyltransferase involved in cell wall biosynthesis